MEEKKRLTTVTKNYLPQEKISRNYFVNVRGLQNHRRCWKEHKLILYKYSNSILWKYTTI